MIPFCDKYIQDAMNQTNKNSSHDPDCITSELIHIGRKNWVTALKFSYKLATN